MTDNSQGEPLPMCAKARLTLFILLGIALAGPDLTVAANAATHHYLHRSYRPGGRALRRPRFRGARGVAAQDAARLGALVGKECRGRADMPRNDHEFVVLCSNGRSYIVDPALAHQSGAPATECSLAGIAPLPDCYAQ